MRCNNNVLIHNPEQNNKNLESYFFIGLLRFGKVKFFINYQLSVLYY